MIFSHESYTLLGYTQGQEDSRASVCRPKSAMVLDSTGGKAVETRTRHIHGN